MTDHRTVDQAERRLRQFERRLLSDALLVGQPDAPALVRHAVDLVAHAALPVVCDAELLHLLRINFFVDAEALPYWVEGRTLLSPLWQDLGDGLYRFDRPECLVRCQAIADARHVKIYNVAKRMLCVVRDADGCDTVDDRSPFVIFAVT